MIESNEHPTSSCRWRESFVRKAIVSVEYFKEKTYNRGRKLMRTLETKMLNR